MTVGHTLVIPRREIVTWWEASPAERAATDYLLPCLRGGPPPTNRQLADALAQGEFDLPAGCSVNFELGAVDLLRRLAVGRRQSGIESFCGAIRCRVSQTNGKAHCLP